MGFFGRQKEKKENEFGKIFHDEETSNYCGLQKKINIWAKKKCYTKERIPAIVIRSHCPQDQI